MLISLDLTWAVNPGGKRAPWRGSGAGEPADFILGWHVLRSGVGPIYLHGLSTCADFDGLAGSNRNGAAATQLFFCPRQCNGHRPVSESLGHPARNLER